jgi:hypothetical protein
VSAKAAERIWIVLECSFGCGRANSEVPAKCPNSRSIGRVACLIAVCGMLGCAGTAARPPQDRWFDFQRDTYSFTNQNYWKYEFLSNSSATTRTRSESDVDYHQRCTIMSRTARQFFYNARFDPDLPPVEIAELRDLVRGVLARNPRAENPSPKPFLIPGFRDLRAFSSEHELLLKDELSGRWLGYFQRGNWRMIFPFSPRSQRETLIELVSDLTRGHLPIVHIVNFPRIDINHTVLVIGFRVTSPEIRFGVYDPNTSEGPRSLVFDRATSIFSYDPTDYFSGGAVKVYEVYDGVFF